MLILDQSFQSIKLALAQPQSATSMNTELLKHWEYVKGASVAVDDEWDTPLEFGPGGVPSPWINTVGWSADCGNDRASGRTK